VRGGWQPPFCPPLPRRLQHDPSPRDTGIALATNLITGITPEVSQFFVEYFLVGKGRGEECIPYLGVQLKLLR